MKSYSNTIYKNIPNPETFDELWRLIFENSAPFGSHVRMWRGQANASWRLDSSAYRRLSLTNKKVTEHLLINYEESLLNLAKHKGYHVLFNGRVLTDFELLALLQHNGAATRLVDFTRNCMIGLWFCCSVMPKTTGLLIGTHAYFLGGHEGSLKEENYRKVVRDLNDFNYPMTWEPPVVTPRIAAQHSQFLYSDISESKQGSLKLDPDKRSKLFVAISPKMKAILRKRLNEICDLNSYTLFPDISGFGYSNSYAVGEHNMYRW